MSDGINDAEGRQAFYEKDRVKHKGRWGVWDCGYFYPDKPKKRKTRKPKKRSVTISENSKTAYKAEIKTWMPMSLMNTYVVRMIRLKGKQDWRARAMYEELYFRLLTGHRTI